MAEYNGWTNYETWCVNLWLENDENTFAHYREVSRECYEMASADKILARIERARIKMAEALKDEIDGGSPLTDANVYSDLLNAALSEVNWDEIAEHYVTDELAAEIDAEEVES